MSTVAYIKPGVSVSEIASPSFTPFVAEQTSVCIVGPAQGYQTYTETAYLSDNAPYTLKSSGVVTSSLVVVDASNVTGTPFVASTALANHDYTVDTTTLASSGFVRIYRSMQTAITNGASVAVYYENSATPVQTDGHTDQLTLNGTTAVAPLSLNASTQAASIRVMSQGTAPAADYTITGAGTGTVTIARNGGATVLGKFQTVYISYTVNGTQYTDVAYQLNNTTTVALPANSTAHVVKTAAGAPSTTAVLYAKASGTTDSDYYVAGSGTTTTIARSAGTTSIGTSTDGLAVQISYQAIPVSYWQPTQCYSQADVEAKFGPAFNSAGTIVNPLSYGCALAFQNGAQSVVAQALFSVTGGVNGPPTGAAADWSNTLANLRAVQGISLIVPLISTGSLTSNDGVNLQALTAVANYIVSQRADNQYIQGIFGEDSTVSGQASMTTLRSHAQALAALSYAESFMLLSPGAYAVTNPITGLQISIGGQYVACAIAGQAAGRAVQTALTRKVLNGITAVTDIRLPSDKNTDAANGLCVVDNYKNTVRVRHSITVVTTDQNKREFSVIRSKFYMMSQIREYLDEQVIGQIQLDAMAPFRVQVLITNVLEDLVGSGVIVTYRGVQTRIDPNNPTTIDIRYSYLPGFPANYVNVQFSIDTSLGTVTTDNTTALTNTN